MFPDFPEDDEEDLKSLVSWGLPGYSQRKKGESTPMAKSTKTKTTTAKRAGARKTKGASKTK